MPAEHIGNPLVTAAFNLQIEKAKAVGNPMTLEEIGEIFLAVMEFDACQTPKKKLGPITGWHIDPSIQH